MKISWPAERLRASQTGLQYMGVKYQHTNSPAQIIKKTNSIKNSEKIRLLWKTFLKLSLVKWNNFFLWRCDPTPVMASSFLRFLDHTQRRTTVGRTPLDEWSVHRRDISQQTDIHAPVGFEPTISAGERPQTYALDRAATGNQWNKT